MKDKQEKALEIGANEKEALAKLGAMPEFEALVRLFSIEEHNIVFGAFKDNSSDPDLTRKKAWHEGRIYELRKILKTFDLVKKGENE